jgi:hydrogenase maturation factor
MCLGIPGQIVAISDPDNALGIVAAMLKILEGLGEVEPELDAMRMADHA